ncbi:hypothetical protein PanWU01x14_040570 [Parasponia andersonii]|uniref:F-box associated domain n=1 Tax=Parasponia andersonii TaxID=3476 RepID=A0A2P5DR78_PARAD|nr:hypothetical protein PanWU01x14_040570 [Parasponia andersonii]
MFIGSEYEKFERHKIVAFHVEKQEFRLISWPIHGDYILFSLEEFWVRLNPSSTSSIEIWTLRDYSDEHWVKAYKINTSARVLGPWEGCELLLHYFGRFVSHNPNTNSSKDINIPPSIEDTEVYVYAGCLVSLSCFS